MRKLWALLFVLVLLPASYSEQRPAERMETPQPPFEGSIAHQTQGPAETILYFPDYVDGGGWSVQLVLSNVDPAEAAEVRGGSLRSRRTTGPGSVRLRLDVRGPGSGQPGVEEFGHGSDSPRLDPGSRRYGRGEWTLDLPARPVGDRSRREARRVGQAIRVVRGRIADGRRRSRRLQAGRLVPPRASHPRRGGERSPGGGGRFLGGFPPIGAHAPGMVRRGRNRYGIPGGLSRALVPSDRGRISVRPPRAAVREAELLTFSGAGDPDPTRRTSRDVSRLPRLCGR